MKMMTLKPTTPDLRITFPGTRDALPAEGALVEMTSYWYERLRDGSVSVVEPKPAEETRRPATPRPSPKKD